MVEKMTMTALLMMGCPSSYMFYVVWPFYRIVLLCLSGVHWHACLVTATRREYPGSLPYQRRGLGKGKDGFSDGVKWWLHSDKQFPVAPDQKEDNPGYRENIEDGNVSGTFSPIDEDPTLPPFPSFDNNLLYAFMDAAYGTGLVVLLCCAVIAYKSQLQSTVSISSTEAEFLAAVTTAKIVKYLRAVLKELDYLIDGPSPLLVDNKAAIDMINKKKPTPRSRHIEIQDYAIQEWGDAHHIIMQHIPGILNMSDDLTKALAWMLHGRHARHSMGHFLPPHAASVPSSVSSLDFSRSNVSVAKSPHRDPSPSEADGR